MPRTDRSTTFRRALALGAALLLATLSCGRDVTGPQGLRVARGFTFDARFETPGLANGVASDLVPFTKVRVLLVNSQGKPVVDQVVDFPSAATEVPLSFTVPLSADAPSSGETMQLALQYVNAQGDTVFRGGPQAVTVAPAVPGSPPPPVPQIPVAYAGPGANATSVTISVNADTVLAGNAFTYTAVARDAQGTIIPNTPIAWRSESPTKATVTNAGSGAGTTLPSRGPALIVAQLLSTGGQADTVRLEILPKAQSVAIVSGNNQTASFGVALAQPLVVQVNATDALGMAGVPVSFAVTAGGGSVSAASVVTGTDGRAQVTWTAGTGLGTQTVTATSTGLTGSPLTFTATAPAVELLHHYPIVTDLTDAVGTAAGTLLGGASVSQGMLVLDGTSGYAEFGSRIVPTSGSYSVSLFVRRRTTGAAAQYISQGLSLQPGFYIGQSAAGTLRVADTWDATGEPAPANDGLFHQVVLTVDSVANQSRLYVDGGLKQTLSQAIATGATGTNTRLGRQFDPGSEYLAGDLDEVRVYRGALTASQVSALYTAGASAPGVLAFQTQPASATAGASLGTITVRALDAIGQLRTSFGGAVTLALGANASGAVLSGTATVNAVNGVATFSGLSLDKVGTGYTLVATASGSTSATSAAFAVTAGAASALEWVQQPSAGSAGSAVSPAMVVRARDAAGNTVTTFTGAVTLALGTNPTAAVLGGTATVNAVAGVATFANVSVDRAGTGYTLVASATGLTSATSATFDMITTNAVNSWTNASGGTWSTASNWSQGRVPIASDSVIIDLAGTYVVTVDTTFTGTYLRVGGGTSTPTVQLFNRTMTLSAGVRTEGTGTLYLKSAALGGTGTLTNAGKLLVWGSNVVTMPVTSVAGSTITLQGDGTIGGATLNLSQAFTNHGLIEMTAGGGSYTELLAVTGGKFINDTDGTVLATAGAGGIRQVSGEFENRGTVTINTSFAITNASPVAQLNSGLITINGGDLLTVPAGSTSSFTNSGTVTVGPGTVWKQLGGTLTQGGSVTGAGTVQLENATLVLPSSFTSTGLAWALKNATMSGPGTFTNGGTATVQTSTLNAPWTNTGTLEVLGATPLSQPFANAAGATLRLRGDGLVGGATFTVASGFTNLGLIEMTSGGGGYDNTLAITSGTLTNGASGLIRPLTGSGGGRFLNATVVNQGTIDLGPGAPVVMTVNGAFSTTGTVSMDIGGPAAGSQHDQLVVSGTATLGGVLNVGLFNGYVPTAGSSFSLVTAGAVSGTFATANLAGGLQTSPTYGATTVSVSGPVLVLVNAWANGVSGNWSTATNWSLGRTPVATDSVVISAAGTYTVTMDVSDTLAALVVGGSGATPTLVTGTRTLRVNGPLSVVAGAALSVSAGGQVAGTAGTAKNDGTVAVAGTFALPIRNDGTLRLQVNGTVSGALTTGDTTSVVEVRASNASGGGAGVTITNGFTNTGRIEFVTADAFYSNSLTVTNGTLTNASTGIIRTIAGFGGKTLSAQLDNQGLVELREALSLSRTSAVHANSGTVALTLADLTVSQSGTTPSFSNTGTITVPNGRTLSVSGGTLNLTGGVVSGASGTLATSGVTLNFAIAEARTRLTLANTTVPGTFTIPAGDSLRLVGGSPTMTLVNNGRLVLMTSALLGGTVTTGDTTSVIEVRASNSAGGGAGATITNGFTNTGRIEFVTADAFYGNSLTVTNGTLTNAPSGIIRTVAGFGGKTLSAQLDNQGLIELREALTLSRPSAVHTNSGTVSLTLADLTVTQSGTTPSFSNTGTITVPNGRTLSVTGGTLNLAGGLLDGPLGTLSTNNVTLNFTMAQSRTRLTLTNTTVPGTFTVPAGDSLRLVGGSPTMTLVNNGRLVLMTSVVLSGSLTTGDTTSVIEVRASNSAGGGVGATITNGFTNSGRIEFVTADAFYGNQLSITNGTLTNAPTGIIRTIAGFGGKTLAAQLNNQGLMELREALTLSRPSAVHTNSGTVTLTLADLTVTQSGTTPSFTNTGTITVPNGRTLSVTGGTLTLTGGTLDAAAGTLATSGTTLNFGIAESRARLALTNTTVPGTFTIPAGDSLRLVGGSPTMTLVNNGRLVLMTSVVLSGSLTTGDTTSVIEVRASNSAGGGVGATITNGFTNTGRIEFVTADAFYGNQLSITNGTLTNAPGGIIRTISGFGGKTLSAQLDNQGLIELREALTLSRPSAVHTNSGTVSLTLADLTVTQSGTTPSFSNTGTITVPNGRTLSVTGGTLNLTGGLLDGPLGSLSTSNVTLNFTMAESRTRLTLTNTTVPGTFTVPAGDSLRLINGSPTMTLVNNGRLVLAGNVVLGGTITTGDTTSVIEVRSSNAVGGGASATITNGFTNTGRIELVTADAFYGNQLTITTGTLTNAPTGIIRSVSGFGGKTLAAQLNNQGLLEVREALTLQRASAAHVNSGTIALPIGDLTVAQSGTSPSFTNTGTITVPVNRTFSVSGGTLTLTGGTLDAAAGTLATSGTTLNFGIAESRARLALTNTTVPGTFTIPAGDSLRLFGGSPTMTLVNNGRLVLQGSVTLGGTIATGDTTSVIEVRASNSAGGGASATITNGFTNTGRIELVTADAFYSNRLAVTTGTLTNAPSGIIRTVAGFGGKTLAAQLNNQGLVDLREALTLDRPSSAHTNSGTIDLALANLSVANSGTTPSFTNTGTINVPASRTLTVNGGGTLDLRSGLVTGQDGLVSVTVTTFRISPSAVVPRLNIITGTTPDAVVIAAGDSLRLRGGTFAPLSLTNDGTLILESSSTVNTATMTTGTGSTILLRGSPTQGSVVGTFTNGFTNTATIDLTSVGASGTGVTLAVTNGTLVNATSGVINTLAGVGGNRDFAFQLDNQGTINLNTIVGLNKTASDHVNSGVINVSGGTFTVSQGGTTPTFTNTGTINLADTRTLLISSGTGIFTTGLVAGYGGTITTANTTVLDFVPATIQPRMNIGSLATIASPITIAAGDSLRVRGTLAVPSITNNGLLVLEGVTNISGPVTNAAGATLLVRGSAATSSSNATASAGIVNSGIVRMITEDGALATTLSLGSATFTNNSGGTFDLAAGTGGTRSFSSGLFENSGAFTVGFNTTFSGPLNQRNLLTVDSLRNLNVTGLLTLFSGSTTTVNGTLTKTGGCTNNGGTIAGTAGFTCP